MNKFWTHNAFPRIHARNLSPYDHSVYMSLCSHANAEGETFIGYRKMAEELGINKDTVKNSIRHLEAYGLVRRLEKINGRVSYLKLLTDRFESPQPSYPVGPKEDIKELSKEENQHKTYKGREQAMKALEESKGKLHDQMSIISTNNSS
jgi:DNA-binding MarR family transcriptional regulator